MVLEKFPTLQASANPVQVIPSPRDIDPRILAWKGVAALGRLDASAELWVKKCDWNLFGMKALKDRSFFL
jgi:actin-related protein 8